jgi:tetratricopeptide (TPR) repeat protein
MYGPSPSLIFSSRTFSAPCVALASIVLLAGSAFADDRAECIKAAGDEAIGACNRLISDGDLGNFAAPAFYNRGTAYTQKSDLDAAVKDFNEALRLDPNFAAAYTARGTAYWLRGKPDLAFADWSEAIRLAPNYPNPYLNSLPYMNRGVLYYGGRHEFDKAIADLDEAIRLDPRNGRAFSNRGWVLGQQGQYQRSIADLDIAIKLTPRTLVTRSVS